jgi:type VII secretion protein EssB
VENEVLRIGKECSIFPKGERDYLIFPNKNLTPGTLSEDEDHFEIALDMNGLKPATNLVKGQGPDRYRFLIACAGLEGLREKYSFSLDPGNLLFDASFTPKVKLRDGAIPGGIAFAIEYKALIASILEPKYSFADYMRGGADLFNKKKQLRGIAPVDETKAIEEILKTMLFDLEGKLAKDSILVGRKKYQAILAVMIVFICLFGALGTFSTKYYMVDVVGKNTAIEISNKFLARDYIGVLAAANDRDIATLSKEERYMSAYAGASVASLNIRQRTAVMNGITLNTDSLYLDYWIGVGLGEYEAALDIAKRMGDDELELYALVIYRDAVSVNMIMSGEEKAGMLKSLDEQIAALQKKINEAGKVGNDG